MLFILALLCIFLLGYLAQTTGLCMVRGVKEATKGAPMFIVAIVFSGSLAWVSMGLGSVVEGRQLSIAFGRVCSHCLVAFYLVLARQSTVVVGFLQ